MPDALRPASAAALLADAFDAFLPPPALDVAAWAQQHRWVTGARPGRWDHAVAPYLTEPMSALTSPLHNTTCIVGPGQCGKTAVAENWLLASIDQDPASLLWYMQTDDSLKSYVKERINPLIETHETVRAKQGLRPVDDSLGYKRFNGMSAQFLVAARSNLINKSARRIVGDEWDAYDAAFGDPRIQLDTRRQSYGRDSMLLAMSHCDRAGGLDDRHWTAGIMQLYAESDRRLWYWPCPDCGAYSSPNPTATRVTTLSYPEDAPLDVVASEARLLCPCCGALIPDQARRQMNLAGKWVGLGQTIAEDGTITGELARRDTAGFWIVGIMSPFLLAGIGGLARALVEATRLRDRTGEDRSLREVTTKQLGIPYDAARRIGTVSAQILAERADPSLALGEVPAGTRVLVTAIDVQANRFELLTRGYAEHNRSSVIAVERIPADPATSAEDWDRLFRRLATLSYKLADGSGRVMRVRASGFDAFGAPGTTQQAYDAWRRHLKSGVRFLGTIRGRDVYNIMPCKGQAGANAAPLQVVYPDHRRRDRAARASGAVPLLLHNANTGKDDVAGQLAIADADAPFAIRFPAGLRAPTPPDPFFEQLAAEQRRPDGKWERIAAGAPNEAWDLLVLTHALARLHAITRIDYAAPPGWAADWDHNSMVSHQSSVINRQSSDGVAESAARAGAKVTPETFNPAAKRAALYA